MASRATSAGWNPRPTKCTSAFSFRVTAPIRPCPDCQGTRFQPEALLYRVSSAECGLRNGPDDSFSLADFYQLPVRDARRFIEQIAPGPSARSAADPLGLALGEVRSRLGYLDEVGLGYLTLDRPTRSLSGGETERVNLTACLGTRLSILCLSWTNRASACMRATPPAWSACCEQLRDAGNTVVVVEHEASVMRAADQIMELGPGHGESGGEVVFQGTFREILQSSASLTGQYLSGRKRIEDPPRRPVSAQDPRLSARAAPRAREPLMLKEAARPFGVRARACPVLSALARLAPQSQESDRRNPAEPICVRHRRERLGQDHPCARGPAARADCQVQG